YTGPMNVMKDGRYEGALVCLDEDGRVNAEFTMVAGVPNGPMRRFDADGDVTIGQYAPFAPYAAAPPPVTTLSAFTAPNGAPLSIVGGAISIGEWKRYDAAGRLRQIYNFDVEGLRHGPQREYGEDGLLTAESTYVRGFKDGLATTWDQSGRAKSETF